MAYFHIEQKIDLAEHLNGDTISQIKHVKFGAEINSFTKKNLVNSVLCLMNLLSMYENAMKVVIQMTRSKCLSEKFNVMWYGCIYTNWVANQKNIKQKIQRRQKQPHISYMPFVHFKKKYYGLCRSAEH